MQLGNFELSVRTVVWKWSVSLFFAVLIVFQSPVSMAQEVTVIRGGTLIDATGAPPSGARMTRVR